MDTQHTYTIIGSLGGLLIGLSVAEFYYLKARKHASHVVPATIVNNSHWVIKQKLFYYAVLLTLFFIEVYFQLKVNDALYWLVGFAIAGGDVQKLANKFFRLK
jgi:hypothetical protein